MRFRKYGRTYQLEVTRPEDLKDVLVLDEAHWVATSAPVSAFQCDPRFLGYLDHDKNGRIRTDELRPAIRWFVDTMADIRRAGEDTDDLRFADVNADCDAGRTIMTSARYILNALDLGSPETITLAQVREFLGGIEKRPLNGDGVITPDAAPDPDTAQFIKDVLTCFDGADDVSGKKGITEAQLDAFKKGTDEYLAWKEKGAVTEGAATKIMALGAETGAVYAIVQEHAREVDTFFEICRAARFEPAATAQLVFPDLTADEERTLTDRQVLTSCLAQLPLAKLTDDHTLPLDDNRVNPLYRQWILALKETVVPAVLKTRREALSEADWQAIQQVFVPYAAYLKEKQGAAVEKLAEDTLLAYRDGAVIDQTRELIEKDKEVAAIVKDAREVEKAILYQQHLLRLVNNFVNFRDLYDIDQRALFEMGSIVIDGRWFNMALPVDDRKAHSAVAKASNIFTVYLEVTGKPGDTPFCVASPATSGTKGNLAVGKRGVFFDVHRTEFDARIVQIIENPISLGEALSAPLVRLWSSAVGKIEAMSASSEKDLQRTADSLTAKPAAAQGGQGLGPAGLLVGMSVSFAALGSAFAFISKTLSSMSPLARLMSLGGAILVVFVPVSLLAFLKLWSQDLGALLEGGGWGINAQMRLNRALRNQFTRCAPYPDDAEGRPRSLRERLVIWAIVAAVGALIAYWAPRLMLR